MSDDKTYHDAVLARTKLVVRDGKTPSLMLAFATIPRKREEQATEEVFWMSLHPKLYERNSSYLERLGVTDVPPELTVNTVQQLEGLGTSAVSLVRMVDSWDNKEKVMYINERRGLKVWPPNDSDNPF